MRRLAYPTIFALAAVLGANCTQDHELRERTVTPLDGDGGLAMSADGLLAVQVPAGALSAPTDIAITTRRDIIGEDLESLVYAFEPAGLTFATPVRLRWESAAPSAEIVVEQVDETGETLRVLSTYADADGVVAETDHFSLYALRALRRDCRNKACGDPCSLCPPGRPGCRAPGGARLCSAAGWCLPAAAVQCSGPADAGPTDAGPAADASRSDVGALDAGISDAGPNDSGPSDAGPTDATVPNDGGATSDASVARLRIQPPRVDFGVLGSRCPGQTVTARTSFLVTNTHFGPVAIRSATVAGSVDFSVAGFRPVTLRPGDAEALTVVYESTDLGPDRGSVELATSIGPHSIAIAGEVLAAPTGAPIVDVFTARPGQTTFVLSQPPNPTTIEVRVNQQRVPVTDWQYDAGLVAVRFVATVVPASGTAVEIQYDRSCP